MSATRYNRKSPAVKRILQEAKELQLDPCPDYCAQPLEDNIFEWHFTVRGADATEFEGGRYHGRILLPNDYPFQPPNLMLLTPNGRFELNKKICLSITGYHPEFWQPAWGIRTVLLGIMGFFPTKSNGAIGGIDYTEAERRLLAKQSRTWKCDRCGDQNIAILPDQINDDRTRDGCTTARDDVPLFTFAYENKKAGEPPANQLPLAIESRKDNNNHGVPQDNTVVHRTVPENPTDDDDDNGSSSSPPAAAAPRSDDTPSSSSSSQQQQISPLQLSPALLDKLILSLLVLLLALVVKKLLL